MRISFRTRLRQPPVLPDEQLEQLWKNTIGYLEGPNLDRIKAYGGRAKRGVLLTGARATGVRALAMVARCVPILFPLWAPLALIASFTRHGETSTGA